MATAPARRMGVATRRVDESRVACFAGSGSESRHLEALMWKRFGSDRPQQTAAAMRGSSLAERF